MRCIRERARTATGHHTPPDVVFPIPFVCSGPDFVAPPSLGGKPLKEGLATGEPKLDDKELQRRLKQALVWSQLEARPAFEMHVTLCLRIVVGACPLYEGNPHLQAVT